jgi:O-acetyl-ADP-ribose deacetylase (regulator of RNase III)/transcriptional regulator with XRE-family HTH domain
MPFKIVRNDLTKMDVDAIVNPTNIKGFGTGGVDGRIHKIEGPRLKKETGRIGSLPPGQCILTKAFNLPARHIIHTVGPIWKDGNSDEEKHLRDCYKNALELGKEQGFESIAFPLISSGSYGFPKDLALNAAVRSIGEYLLFHEMTVYLVVYDKKAYQLSADLSASVEAYIDEHYIDEHRLHSAGRLIKSDIFSFEAAKAYSANEMAAEPKKRKGKSLNDALEHLDETFSERLLRLIDEKNLKDPEVYKKANISKQTFSKIRNEIHYSPTKPTALAFAIALELNLDETKDLLLKSGYALSRSSRFDVIISYFIESGKYDIFEINEVLFAYNENLLGV